MVFAVLVDNFDIRMNLPGHILAAILVAVPMLHGEESVLPWLVFELRGRGSASPDYRIELYVALRVDTGESPSAFSRPWILRGCVACHDLPVGNKFVALAFAQLAKSRDPGCLGKNSEDPQFIFSKEEYSGITAFWNEGTNPFHRYSL